MFDIVFLNDCLDLGKVISSVLSGEHRQWLAQEASTHVRHAVQEKEEALKKAVEKLEHMKDMLQNTVCRNYSVPSVFLLHPRQRLRATTEGSAMLQGIEQIPSDVRVYVQMELRTVLGSTVWHFCSLVHAAISNKR
eukprot:scaffold79182_cov20-Tisochrysis_lutea.AAC.1